MSEKQIIIDTALIYNGYLEKKSNGQLESFTANAGKNNYTVFSKYYKDFYGENFQGQPWCAMFVSTVVALALGVKRQETLFPHFAYCPSGIENFKAMGKWHLSDPQSGDIVFFNDNSGLTVHVGIVYQTDKDKIYTIEGNTSSASGVIANGGAVAKKSYFRTYGRIAGYGRPSYASSIADPDTIADILSNRGIITNLIFWKKRFFTEEADYWLGLKTVNLTVNAKGPELTKVNDIVWELSHRGIITDKVLWMRRLEQDTDSYHLARKICLLTKNRE